MSILESCIQQNFKCNIDNANCHVSNFVLYCFLNRFDPAGAIIKATTDVADKICLSLKKEIINTETPSSYYYSNQLFVSLTNYKQQNF